jgi:hypothetical protein
VDALRARATELTDEIRALHADLNQSQADAAANAIAGLRRDVLPWQNTTTAWSPGAGSAGAAYRGPHSGQHMTCKDQYRLVGVPVGEPVVACRVYMYAYTWFPLMLELATNGPP